MPGDGPFEPTERTRPNRKFLGSAIQEMGNAVLVARRVDAEAD
jgi:hypothetical protein